MPNLGKRLRRVLPVVLLLAMTSLAVSAQQGSDDASQADTLLLDCSMPESLINSQFGKEWMKRSLLAQHCVSFQARAVRAGPGGVRTLVLLHDVRDGVERDELIMLDDSPVTYERDGVAVMLLDSEQGLFPASPDAITQHLDDFYQFRLSENQRIAGRSAVRLDIEPRDDFRYGRRQWIDVETALPLKQELLGERGVLETFQLVELDVGRRYPGTITVEPSVSVPGGQWQPGWLPPGFVRQPVKPDASLPGRAHHLYSDGLATLSLFIEPLQGQPSLKPGVHRLGASQAAVLQRRTGDQLYQIMAMGELPSYVLQRVASSTEAFSLQSDSELTPQPTSQFEPQPGSLQGVELDGATDAT
ncbi:MAG: MucB/RseB C-terminal domain-containing protein [Halomonas sp.]|uniref:MucB/RseB C-terminal domain-containing protein n=1 Tax=Halomonas sp. TaxID=1486246 RepID=UPI003F8F2F60